MTYIVYIINIYIYIYTIEKIQYWKNELNFNKYLFEYIVN